MSQTLPTDTVGPSGPPVTVTGPGAGQVWRRLRVPLLLALCVVIAAVIVGLAQSRTVHGELDPRAVDPAGSRALATLLADRGVDVSRVTHVDDAVNDATAGTTVFVPFPDRIPTATLAMLAQSDAERLVLVAPTSRELRVVTDGIRPLDTTKVRSRDPSCDEPMVTAAGTADLGGQTYNPGRYTGCYRAGTASTVVVGERNGGGSLVVVGAGDAFTNERLDQRGNAALALLMLGADGTSDRVVWLMSVPGSAATDTTSLTDVVPPWAVTAAIQLLLAGLVVAWWRGRRLGPPVVEPLPVVVRAAETVEGRARLYRRAGASDRATDALRAGALARLVPRLGLGADPSPPAVVQAVAERSGWPAPHIGALLFGAYPIEDAALVRLADELDGLVAATLRTATPDSEVDHL